jgi:hypothetical protein
MSSAIRGVFFADADHGWVAASARAVRARIPHVAARLGSIGENHPRLQFSAERFLALRDHAPIAPGSLAAVAGLTVGQSRRLLTGTFEPNAGDRGWARLPPRCRGYRPLYNGMKLPTASSAAACIPATSRAV